MHRRAGECHSRIMAERITELIKEAWGRIEGRVHRRLGGWSVRRRWVALVAVPLIFCCCGSVVGIPVWWAIRETIDAGRGEASPAAAAVVYFGALGYGEQPPLALLDDDAQDELARQYTDFQAAMRATDGGGPSKLNIIDMSEGPIVDGRSTVDLTVSATWWGKGGTAGTSLESRAHPWRLDTIEDDGWRVAGVQAPAWCGPGAYVWRCPGDPSPAPSTPTESASPSPAGILDRLRSKHPCGPFAGADCATPAPSTS